MQAKYKWLLLPPAIALILFLGPLRGTTSPASPTPTPTANTATQPPATDTGQVGTGIPTMPGMDQLISTLLGVLILGSVGLVVFARMRKPKTTGTSTLVEHRQSMRITPKHHVHVLEFDNQLFLLGTCESNLSVLKVSDSSENEADEMEIARREEEEDEGAVPKDLIIPRPPARKGKPKPALDIAQFKKLLAKAKAGQL